VEFGDVGRISDQAVVGVDLIDPYGQDASGIGTKAAGGVEATNRARLGH
jgi:hypothetical protein